MRDFRNWILGIFAALLGGIMVYGVQRGEQITADVTQIKIWQAETNTASGYEKKSYDKFTAKLEEVSDGVNSVRLDVRDIKDTQTKTWEKVLELDARLRDVELQVNEMKRVVYRTER